MVARNVSAYIRHPWGLPAMHQINILFISYVALHRKLAIVPLYFPPII